MKGVFLVARYGINGGTGTLSIRMAKWLHKHDYMFVYMCCENDNEFNYLELEKYNTKIIIDSDRTYSVHFGKLSGLVKNIIVMVYSLEEYLSLIKIQSISDRIVNVFFYVVHPLIFGELDSNESWIRKLYRNFNLRDFIHEIHKNGDLIFMDEECLNTAIRLFNLKLNNANKSILRLPFGSNSEKKVEQLVSLEKKNVFTVLTISRIEFPFKGYILGLIDAYILLRKKNYNIRLLIIGDGSDYLIMVDKIASLEPEFRNGIELISRVPYLELEKYFKMSHLYVGMGTTILDSVANLVPALVVDAYSYKMVNVRRFNIRPDNLGSIASAKNDSENALEEIEAILVMNEYEYKSLVRSQLDMLVKLYEIDVFFHSLFDRKIGDFSLMKHKFLRFKVMLLPGILFRIRSFIKRISLFNNKN